jgi:hypothetical protein
MHMAWSIQVNLFVSYKIFSILNIKNRHFEIHNNPSPSECRMQLADNHISKAFKQLLLKTKENSFCLLELLQQGI